ncbi:MAG TPA: aminoacyl--tRNA ligase-related protein, partial [Thermoplasmata archaeon]|nr:aminoacyl--tRNA ligase-related protein [Thermoplasmata archaeon]
IDWYLAALEAANLTDKRYPVKGMNVWTPYGLQARRQLDAVMIREIEATGSIPVEFPTLIPQTEFQKEKDHIKGFDAQVYWVTRGGESTLDIPLVLRPTSETAMYPIFALWIRSHKDLPLNVYQIVNTFRYETKTTRPFLRVREIHFFEEHTCQVDEATATARVASNLAAFAAMARAFLLPYLAIRRPEWDKFPGAYYSVALDIPVGEGRSLQIGSIHHYRENFSRPYGIGYEAADGTRTLVHQTTFGLSERLLGAIVAVHGDGKGVVFPSAVAPVQVVLIPIPGKGAGPDPVAAARALAARLAARGLRVKVDDAEDRPGAKYYRWETLGAPLRLEIGGREAAAGTASAVSRLGARSVLGPENLEGAIVGALADADGALAARAQAAFVGAFAVVHALADLKGIPKIAQIAWCGSEACGHRVEEAIDGALLGTPEGDPPILGEPLPGCLACGSRENVRWALAARPL